jgi:hypothetical protein
MSDAPAGMDPEMWAALTRDYPPAVPEPCNDCPWRRNATPGWLGPHTAEEWIKQAHSDTPNRNSNPNPKLDVYNPARDK